MKSIEKYENMLKYKDTIEQYSTVFNKSLLVQNQNISKQFKTYEFIHAHWPTKSKHLSSTCMFLHLRPNQPCQATAT